MSETLEAYLVGAAARMRRLPPEIRDAELAEMRQHLAALVESGLLLGESEDEAVAAALRQFDASNNVARDLSRVWCRGRVREFLARNACSAALGATGGALFGLTVGALMDIATAAGSGSIVAGWWSPVICVASLVVLWALFMGTTDALLPTMPARSAVKGGAVMGLVAGACCIAVGVATGLYNGPATFGEAFAGIVAVLAGSLSSVWGLAGGQSLNGSSYVAVSSAAFAFIGIFWRQLSHATPSRSDIIAARQ